MASESADLATQADELRALHHSDHPLVLPNALLTIYIFIGLSTMVVSGLSLLMGFAGQVSLGQAAFYALGAYSAGLLARDLNVPPVLALMGLQFGYLLGGSILVETVFNWPGSGNLLNLAIFRRDIPVLQATILVLAAFFVLLNLLVDIAQAAIDPRIRR